MPKARKTISAQVDQWIKTRTIRQLKLERRIFVALMDELVDNTPYKTGLMKGSWFASEGKRGGMKKGVRASIFGGVTKDRMREFAATHSFKQKIFVYNTAGYSRAVEFGTSRMAARAPLRRTLAKARSIARREIAAFRATQTR